MTGPKSFPQFLQDFRHDVHPLHFPPHSIINLALHLIHYLNHVELDFRSLEFISHCLNFILHVEVVYVFQRDNLSTLYSVQ